VLGVLWWDCSHDLATGSSMLRAVLSHQSCWCLLMSQVVKRLEDIALDLLNKQQSQAAAAAAAAAEREGKAAEPSEAAAAAEPVAQEQQQQPAELDKHQDTLAAADVVPGGHTLAVSIPDSSACPTCNQLLLSPRPPPFGGLARALSTAAREAAAGGAAADAAAAAAAALHHHHQQQHRASAAGDISSSGLSAARKHHYEVLIQNDDDPITAEAVAHTLNQYEGSSMSSFSRSLAGQPHAVQQQVRGGTAAAARGGTAAAGGSSSSSAADRAAAGPSGLSAPLRHRSQSLPHAGYGG